MVRGILADIVNASKANKLITTDAQIVSVIRSRVDVSTKAAAEFGAADRHDLKDKEEEQIGILQRYLDSIRHLSEDEIREAAVNVANKVQSQGKKLHEGLVIKGLIGEGGIFFGKPIEMPQFTRIIREVVKENRLPNSSLGEST